MDLKLILDFTFMTVFFIFIYSFLKKTDAVKIFIGLLVWFLIYIGLDYVGLTRTAFLMEKGFELMSLGLLVIFHPELRMFLKKIGGFAHFNEEVNIEESSLREIKKAVFEMAKNSTGAMIIIDGKNVMPIDNGTFIEASCKHELIENVFFKNSPLHDGAMVIKNGKVEVVGVKLPYSGAKRKELGYLGTRHHVALETSLNNDIIAIIVSEETGKISVAENNILNEIKNKQEFDTYFSLS